MEIFTPINTQTLVKKIKNQFLAAFIILLVIVVSAIVYISGKELTTSLTIWIILALVFICLIGAYMISRLSNKELERFKEKQKDDVMIAAQKISNFILGLGEICLDSNITDNRRKFVADALSTGIETYKDTLNKDEDLLKSFLLEIKSFSDSEITLKEKFSEVLSLNN